MISNDKIAKLLNLFDPSNLSYANQDFKINNIDNKIKDELVLEIIKMVYHSPLKESGPHRLPEWEKGWSENLEKLNQTEDLSSLIPGYFSNNVICRLGSEFYLAESPQTEPDLLRVVQIDLLKKFSLFASHVYEFGCGSGNNLRNIRDALPGSKIIGLDWAKSSQEILNKMIDKGLFSNLEAANFNFFEPDYNFHIEDNSTVLTCAALEQVGEKWELFLDFLIKKSPSLIINIEPISELLDNSILLNFLSSEYGKRRNYLKGYYHGLLELENNNKIKIVYTNASALGSKYINGYSIVVWRVC